MNIAFLGLGAMGSRMAATLLSAGHALSVWNRSPDKTHALAARGARVAETPRAAAAGADLVMAMVMDDAASAAVWLDPHTGALAGMLPGAIAVEHSTISIDAVRALVRAADARGIDLLTAPVAGTLPPAERGELVVIVGGAPSAMQRAMPAFDAIGKGVLHAGNPVSANTAKLVINGLLATQEAQLAELMGLTRRLGVDQRRVFDILCQTPVASPMLRQYGQLMLDGTDSVNFPMQALLKDLGLMRAAAEQTGAALPVIAATADSFQRAADSGLAARNQTEIQRFYDR